MRVDVRPGDGERRCVREAGEVSRISVGDVLVVHVRLQELALQILEERRLVVPQVGIHVVLGPEEHLAVRLPHPVVLAPGPLRRRVGRRGGRGAEAHQEAALRALFEVHDHAVHVELRGHGRGHHARGRRAPARGDVDEEVLVQVVERAPDLRLDRVEEVVGERVALGLPDRLLAEVELGGAGGRVGGAGAERQDERVRGGGEPLVVVRRERAEGGAVDAERRGELRRAVHLPEGQRGRAREVDLPLQAHDEACRDAQHESHGGGLRLCEGGGRRGCAEGREHGLEAGLGARGRARGGAADALREAGVRRERAELRERDVRHVLVLRVDMRQSSGAEDLRVCPHEIDRRLRALRQRLERAPGGGREDGERKEGRDERGERVGRRRDRDVATDHGGDGLCRERLPREGGERHDVVGGEAERLAEAQREHMGGGRAGAPRSPEPS